jgi:hypothetical protein
LAEAYRLSFHSVPFRKKLHGFSKDKHAVKHRLKQQWVSKHSALLAPEGAMTAAAAEMDTAESPDNQPNQPECLPVARATGGGDQGRSVDYRSPPSADPIAATSYCACKSTHIAMVRWGES